MLAWTATSLAVLSAVCVPVAASLWVADSVASAFFQQPADVAQVSSESRCGSTSQPMHTLDTAAEILSAICSDYFAGAWPVMLRNLPSAPGFEQLPSNVCLWNQPPRMSSADPLLSCHHPTDKRGRLCR